MKVSELIEELKKCRQDAEVILQSDPEGNSYSPIAGADGILQYYEEEERQTFSFEDVTECGLDVDDLLPCCVLWPMY